LFAESEAAGFYELCFGGDALGVEFFFKCFVERNAFVGFACGSCTYEDIVFVCHDFACLFNDVCCGFVEDVVGN